MTFPTTKPRVTLLPMTGKHDEKVSIRQRKPGKLDDSKSPAGIEGADIGLSIDPGHAQGILESLRQAGLYATQLTDLPGFIVARLKPQALATIAVKSQQEDWDCGIKTPAFDIVGSETGVSRPITPALREDMAFRMLAFSGLLKNPHIKEVISPELLPFNRDLFSFNDTPSGQILLQCGENVATYFEFLDFAFRNLRFPAMFAGFALQFYDYSLVVNAVFLGLSLLVVYSWRFQERILAAKWGSSETNALPQSLATPNKAFQGTSSESRHYRQLAFIPVAIVLIFLYFICLVVLLGFEVFCTQLYDGEYASVVALLPTGVNVVATKILALVYGIILKGFVDWEDYPTMDEKARITAQRKFWLTCLLNYAPLFLTAFIYLPFGHLLISQTGNVMMATRGTIPVKQAFMLNTDRLRNQAVYFAFTNQIVAVGLDTILPLALDFVFNRKYGYAKAFSRAEFNLDERLLAACSLIGYGLLITPIYPAAAASCCIGLWIQSRASLLQLTSCSRCPIPRRGTTIGIWNTNLLFLVGLASVITPVVCVMYSSTEKYSATQSYISQSVTTVLAVALISENVFLLLSKIIDSFFKGLPLPVSRRPASVQPEVVPPLTPIDIAWNKSI